MGTASAQYISCMKLNGFPILSPIITSEYRKELLRYQQQAVAVEKRLRDANTSETRTSIEHTISFNESNEASTEQSFKKVNKVPFTNLTCDIQVSQYTNNEFQVLFSDQRSLILGGDLEESIEKSSIEHVRRNSYTLENPSSFLIDKLVNTEMNSILNETSDQASFSINNVKCETILPKASCFDQSCFNQKFSNTEMNDSSIKASLKQTTDETAESESNKIITLSSDTETELMNLSIHSSFESYLNSEDLHNEVNSSTAPKVEQQNQELYKILTDIPKHYSDKLLSLLRHEDDDDDRATTKWNRERWAANIIVAWSRGHLVRRLLRSAHAQRLVDTIRAALVCAVQLHGETEDRIDAADVELHRRLIQQVSAACCDFHDVFFRLSTAEQMRIIRADRLARQNAAERVERPLTAHGRVMALASRRIRPHNNMRTTTPATSGKRLFPPLSAAAVQST